jgi:4-hydroxy 2-oxovalerate aldolase
MLKILDCTLRDGGYYNNWHFNDELVQNYLRAMEACSINTVELGFRFIDAKEHIGPYGVSDENFLASLNLPSSLNYAVMINGKEYLDIDEDKLKDQIGKIFLCSQDSCISMIRIAINFNDALDSRALLRELKDLGYQIGLNLMQSSGKKETEYEHIASEIQSWNLVDVLYFADSFGNMDPDDVSFIVNSLKKGWKGELGFHSHNNKGFALGNSIRAIEKGVTFCDSTVTGMGRGAGNVTTESLLMELENKKILEVDLSLLQGTVSDFSVLKTKYGWGTNMHYQYAANNNIHPTFVQTLSDDDRYDQFQSFKILEALAQEESSTSFSHESLRSIVYKDKGYQQGSWDPIGFLQDKEVLLVGGGSSVGMYKDEIVNFINRHNSEVIFLNLNRHIPSNLGVATIVSHEIRAFLDASFYNQLSHPLILPMQTLGSIINKYIHNIEILDYGLNLKEGEMDIGSHSCSLDSSVVAGYALAVCTRGGAKKINLVGFDGYQKDDIRYQEMSELIRRYTELDEAVELVSLTPTLYPLKVSSFNA